MIKPYTAVGLIPTVRGIRKCAEYREQVIKRQIQLMHERGIWVEPER